MEPLKKINNLLMMVLVCTLFLLYSCRTDLVYGTRGNRVETNHYSDYQNRNLLMFDVPRYKNLKNGKHGRLYHELMRPFKNNGRPTRQYLPLYRNE